MLPLANNMLLWLLRPEVMFPLGVVMLTFILMRQFYRYSSRNRRRNRNEPAIDAQPRPTDAWDGAKADASARIERQKVELHEYSRDVTAQIDSKLILMQELIAKSQSQIDRLEALLAEAEEKTAADARR